MNITAVKQTLEVLNRAGAMDLGSQTKKKKKKKYELNSSSSKRQTSEAAQEWKRRETK